jgi:hypothetical protein
MELDMRTAPAASRTMLWVGRVISTLMVLFMLLDGVMKLVKPAPVVDATVQLGFQQGDIAKMGIIVLVCAILYAIPRTAVLGAILLTGWLGGAVAAKLRIDSSPLSTFAPVIFGLFVWLGILLRDRRLQALIPLRRFAEPM